MAADGQDRTPLLAEEGEIRRRGSTSRSKTPQESERGQKWSPENDPDWNPNLPYGGKVYLARKKKPDPLHVRVIEDGTKKKKKRKLRLLPKPDVDSIRYWEAAVVIGTIAFALYAYYYFDHLHYNVTRGYAHLGYSSAQHQIGQRFFHGMGVEKDQYHAMDWFKKAADQGHPHASYNLAVGHLQGIRTDLLSKGDPHRLIAHAASKGVKEAHHALNEICPRGGCE